MKKILPIIFLILSFSSFAFAQTIDDCANLPVEQKVQCYQNKVNDLRGQTRTLSAQIAVMNNQINLTQARIESTKKQISELNLDIDTTSKKIINLEKALDNLIKVLINRMVATYQVGQAQPFEILLSSNNISNFFSRLNYLRIVQQHDKELIFLTQQAKSDYANQKDIFEEKKDKAQALKSSLENYTAQLAQDRVNKQNLLLVTSSDEAKFQQLLSQAQAERSIVFGGGTDSFMRDVNQGDSIGFIASYSSSPGCSTGAHLHFEVQKDGSVQNPNFYLRGANYAYPSDYDQGYYGSVNPTGDLPWPLNEQIIIHQGYGSHGFAQQFYQGGVHTGIDMDSNSSKTVKTIKAGKLYGGSYSCSNGKLYYAKVIHDGGLITWYLHTIPQ